jgi:signal recognition particle receptor subunit beta
MTIPTGAANHARGELNLKIVYCGPDFAGKSTSLTHIYEHTDAQRRGKLMRLATKPPTVAFDFLPLNLGKVGGLDVRLHLIEVPPPDYASSRHLIFKGASGVVFVADSVIARSEANRASLEELRGNLAAHGYVFDQIPLVFQYNKRDLQDILSMADLSSLLNTRGAPETETVATKGQGVLDCLMTIVKQMLLSFDRSAPTRDA